MQESVSLSNFYLFTSHEILHLIFSWRRWCKWICWKGIFVKIYLWLHESITDMRVQLNKSAGACTARGSIYWNEHMLKSIHNKWTVLRGQLVSQRAWIIYRTLYWKLYQKSEPEVVPEVTTTSFAKPYTSGQLLTCNTFRRRCQTRQTDTYT